jgi:hypothetical protein
MRRRGGDVNTRVGVDLATLEWRCFTSGEDARISSSQLYFSQKLASKFVLNLIEEHLRIGF